MSKKKNNGMGLKLTVDIAGGKKINELEDTVIETTQHETKREKRQRKEGRKGGMKEGRTENEQNNFK